MDREEDRKREDLERCMEAWKDHWQQIQERMRERAVFWKGEGARDCERLYEKGVKIPLNQWIREVEDEKDKLFPEGDHKRDRGKNGSDH